MTSFIPPDFVDDVRNRVDIVDFISEYVVLKKTGQNYVGLCPFHLEKTPSFTVSPGKQIFYCFGCGAGGNVITFLMKKDNLSFPEAVEVLAQRLGLTVPAIEQAKREQFPREKYYELNRQAAEFYHSILCKDPAAEKARSYLSGRGIEPETWEKFMLGFAPERGQDLLDFLAEKGCERRILVETGLFVSRQGVLMDRFQGRVMFPIFDARGRCLGFGARTLGAEQPKYLNSPESFIFNKSQNLYGLNHALSAIREKGKVLVVEGYLDCISAHQHGFLNTVAALGTAFTRDQARLLLRYTQDVILAFDQDAAGSAASLRGAGYLQELGARVYVLDLPEAKDPDEFLRNRGGEAFASVLESRVMTFFEFKLEQLMKQHDPRTAFGKVEIVQAIFDDLAGIDNMVVRDGYIKLLGSRLNIAEETVRGEFFRFLGRQRLRKDRKEKIRYNMEQGKKIIAGTGLSAVEAAERGLFRFMCLDRNVWQRVESELGLDAFHGKVKELVLHLKNFNWGTPAELLGLVSESEQAELASILLNGDELEVDEKQQEKMMDDYIRVLKKEKIRAQIKNCQDVLAQREKDGALEGIKDLLGELHYLYEQLEALKRTE